MQEPPYNQESFLTRVLHPLLEDLLEPADVQRLGGHADQGHDLEELLLAGLDELVDVVAALRDEHVEVGEQVGALQDAVQLQLGLVVRLRGHRDCKKKTRSVV